MRVLLYDMLMSQEEASAQLLLRVSAAVTAWPQPLQQDAIGDDELLGQAVLAAQRDMCSEVLGSEAAQADDTVTAADTDSGTSSAKNVDPGALGAAVLRSAPISRFHQIFGMISCHSAICCAA